VREAREAGLELEAVFVGPGTVAPPSPGVATYEVAPGVVERIASTINPQAILAIARRCDVAVATVAAKPGFVVVCAGIADPGNAGTILRSAEASGAAGVVFTVGSVDVFNPKVVRASAGALFHVAVAVGIAPADLKKLERPLFGAVARDGIPYDDAPLDEPCALVLGSESHGLPDGIALDGLISIPHAGRAESLNVAMAATVLCFEAARRRR
jgi:TrmH family RNA methyltransferase